MFKIIALIRMFVNCDSQVISPAKPDFHIRCNQFVSPSHVLLPCGYLLDYGLTSLLLSTIFVCHTFKMEFNNSLNSPPDRNLICK